MFPEYLPENIDKLIIKLKAANAINATRLTIDTLQLLMISPHTCL